MMALVLGFIPSQVPDNPGTQHIPDNTGTQTAPDTPGPPADPGSQADGQTPATPGPNASAKAKRRAYGQYCVDQSRKRVEGEQGTPFSKCVTAIAKLASGQTDNPAQACKSESKKHVKGEKGTPFSRCVKAAAQLLQDQEEAAEDEGTEEEAPAP